EIFIISRGTWFYDGTWGPVEEMKADRIELEHLTHFRGHLMTSQKVDDTTKEVVHSLSLPEGEVDWFSASEVYLSSDATPSRLMRSVGKKFGFQKTGYKLHRGYSIDATSSDKPPDINHIVFVIHGIGQKMERGRIIKNCTALRENISYLKHKYFPSIVNSSHTVEFFPVEWRSSLVLDAGVIDSITPQKILNLRQMLNASFMDIMYYNSPLYRDEIITGLTGEMNRLYTMFTQRNPYFEANGGKVSMVAHSLGCVITYDIVTGWNPAQQFDQQLVHSLFDQIDKSRELKTTSQISLKKNLQDILLQHDSKRLQPSLNFKIENFFCLGSPLAVFLALRTKHSQGATPDIIPQKLCKRLLNIFHPADPVAYRIEPLLCPEYSNIAPVLIHSYNAAEKIHYSEMPLEPIIVSREKDREGWDKSRADSGNNTPVSSVPSTPVKGGTSSWSLWGLMKGSKKPAEAGANSLELLSALQDAKGLSDRTDFVLREGSMENSYISAITSHTAYWNNYDVSHFLLSILYPDIVSTVYKPEVAKP
ncbi:Phospholipase DDHD1-like, partial [Homarus americanus]